MNLLARLITAEAGGQTYNTQIAVGAVVVNRVKSGIFPNSISAVINQTSSGYYQFTTVQNGIINKPAQASAVSAALAALNGNDPTKNALFFHDDIGTSNAWSSAQPVSIKIDNMTFNY